MKKGFLQENKKVIIACIIGCFVTVLFNNIPQVGKFIISPFTSVKKTSELIYRIDTTATSIVRVNNILANKVDVSELKERNLEIQKQLDLKADEDIVELGFKNLSDKLDLLSSFLLKSAKNREQQTEQQIKEYEKDRRYWYDMQREVRRRDSLNLANSKIK
jgi:hypothetical protein